MLLIVLLIILGFGVEFPHLYTYDSCAHCQFADLTHTDRCYWYHVLSHPERDQLQSCLDILLAELESWLKAKLNHMSQAIKHIYINLNIGYGHETNLLLQ